MILVRNLIFSNFDREKNIPKIMFWQIFDSVKYISITELDSYNIFATNVKYYKKFNF